VALHRSIAIDGPAGAGKSTVAKAVARRLGLLYVDTGAMYRAVAYLTIRYGVTPSDEIGVLDVLSAHPLHFERRSDGTLEVYVDGEPISGQLRSPAVSDVVSPLSIHSRVRARLTQIQRSFCESHGVVMDGRDIGTVVIPDASLKVFLTASLAERAARRAEELKNQGHNVDRIDIQKAIEERDQRDSSREIAPLRPAPDARILDSTGKSVDAMVEQILAWVSEISHG